MSVPSRSLRCSYRNLAKAIGSSTKIPQTSFRLQPVHTTKVIANRALSTFKPSRMPGLMPDTEHPEPPKIEELDEERTAASINDEDYHKHADEFMNKLYERAEGIVEERDDVEVEFSAGVLSITMPPNGSYVINKQPPNKQIWLSSPISGPKRFDWSVVGESMDQKEGSGSGDWIYLRDGTSFSELLRKELGIDVSAENLEKELAQNSTDPIE